MADWIPTYLGAPRRSLPTRWPGRRRSPRSTFRARRSSPAVG